MFPWAILFMCFMCINVCLNICLCTIFVQCPWRPEKDIIRSFGNGVTDKLWAALWVLRIEHGSSGKATSVPNSWAISPGPNLKCFIQCLLSTFEKWWTRWSEGAKQRWWRPALQAELRDSARSLGKAWPLTERGDSAPYLMCWHLHPLPSGTPP